MEQSPTVEALALLAEAERNVIQARELVGLTITVRRKALGLGVRQLARIAHVDASELSRLERGNVGKHQTIGCRSDAALTALERERAPSLRVSA